MKVTHAKVHLLNSDIFTNKSADAIIIPRSTNGTINSSFQEGLKKYLGYSYRQEKSTLGTVVLDEVNNKAGVSFLMFVTCVNTVESSSKAIYQIIQNIAEKADIHRMKGIAFPLLGSGAGGLEPGEAFYHFIKALNQSIVNYQIALHIPDRNNYQIVNRFYSIAEKDQRVWWLNVTGQNWSIDLDEMKIGERVNFTTRHTNGNKRKIFSNYFYIREGDIVFCYETQKNPGLKAILKITKEPRYIDEIQNTFTGEIDQKIERSIQLSDITGATEFRDSEIVHNNNDGYIFKLTDAEFNFLHRQIEATFPSDVSAQLYVNNSSKYYNYAPEGKFDHKDQLDFDKDIEAFSNLLVYKKVNPPLAIGLFGNWGSGKSFFIKKLNESIQTKSGTGNPDICKNIVHIHFNSWHYSDSNLWASLINEIFEELGRYADKQNSKKKLKEILYEKLETSTILLGDAKDKLTLIKERKSKLEGELSDIYNDKKEKIQKLKDIKVADIFSALFKEETIKKDIAEIEKDLINQDVIQQITDVDDQIRELGSPLKKISHAFEFLAKENKKALFFFLLIPMLIYIVVLLIRYFSHDLKFINSEIAAFLLSVNGVLLVVLNKVRPFYSRINQAYKRLVSLRKSLEDLREAKLKEDNEKEVKLKIDLQNLENEEQAAKSKISSLNHDIDEANKEIEEIKSGKRLINFIKDRNNNKEYQNQLGIISWIRKDFERLNDIMLEQKEFEDKEEGAFQIDRIILYIDDLDRCDEHRVLQVLEAVHLLLAFPLFAVVVGVDPRWLNNALELKFSDLLIPKSNSHGQGDKINKPACTYDYLEKIFQIPFSLRPVNEEGAKRLIKSLLSIDNSEEETIEFPQDNEQKMPQTSDSVLENTNTQNTEYDQSDVIEHDYKPKIDTIAALEIKKDEIEFMVQLSVLIGQTPRTINRYINVYRIIRSHPSLKIINDKELLSYKSTMLLLAIVIGKSSLADVIVSGLKRSKESNLKQFLVAESHDDLHWLNRFEFSDVMNMKLSELLINIDLISRFSFRALA